MIDLQSISLPLYDIDDLPSHPNYQINVGKHSYQSSKIQIVTLPKRGVLYLQNSQCGSTDVLNVHHQIIRNSQNEYNVKFRPFANLHSTR